MSTLLTARRWADLAPDDDGSNLGIVLILVLAVVVAILALVFVLRRRR